MKINVNIKNFLIYNFPVWIPVVVNFLIFPLYTNYLSPSDFGFRAIILLSILILEILSNFGINWVIRARYFELESYNEKKSFVSTILVFSFGLRIILYILFYYFGLHIFPFFFENWGPIHNELFYLQLLIFFFGFSNEVFFALYVLEKHSKQYSFAILLQYFIKIIISVVFLVIHNQGIHSLFYGDLIGVVIFQIFSFFYFSRYICLAFDKTVIKDLIKIGLPAMPKSLFERIQLNIDQYIIQMFLPVFELGIFARSQFIYNGALGLNKAFSNAFSPVYLEETINNNREYSPKKIMLYWLFTLSLIIIFSALFMVDVFRLIGVTEEFMICAKYAPLYSLNILITSYVLMHGNNILISKSTYLYTIRSFFSGLINIILNIILIPNYGILGAIAASLVSALVFFIIEYCFSEKYLGFNTDVVVFPFLLLIIMIIFIFYLVFNNLIVSLILKSIIFFSFTTILLIIDYFYIDDSIIKKLYR